jgi:hypothetical protein
MGYSGSVQPKIKLTQVLLYTPNIKFHQNLLNIFGDERNLGKEAYSQYTHVTSLSKSLTWDRLDSDQ